MLKKRTVRRSLGIALATVAAILVSNVVGQPNTAQAQGGPPGPVGPFGGILDEIIDEIDDNEAKIDAIQEFLDEVFRPDLVPVKTFPTVEDPNPGPDAFCTLEEGTGNLVVKVMNQGLFEAAASTTRVTFSTSGGPVPVDEPYPVIPVNGMESKSIPIPGGCFIPDCFFTITADNPDDVDELNEGNNSAEGLCIG